MAYSDGSKSGGRRAGTPNKGKVATRERIEEGCDPIGFMMRVRWTKAEAPETATEPATAGPRGAYKRHGSAITAETIVKIGKEAKATSRLVTGAALTEQVRPPLSFSSSGAL
jgi:hypothetical protein